MTTKPTKEELQTLWAAETKAGTTKLTYNEWAAQRIMAEARGTPVKKATVDKKPKTPAKKNKSQPVDKDTPSPKAEKKSKQSGGTAKEKPAPSAPDDAQDIPKDVAPDITVDDNAVLSSGLTAKQEMFCREYLVDYNATQAAIRAGYSAKTAKQQGSRLLTIVDVQTFLMSLQKPKLEALDVSADRILREYQNMAFANQFDFMARNEDGTLKVDANGLPYHDFSTATRDQMAGLAGMKVTILPSFAEDEPNPIKIETKLGDKKGALDVLAKRAGLLKEHVEHSGEVKIKTDGKDLAMRVAFMLRQAAARDKKGA